MRNNNKYLNTVNSINYLKSEVKPKLQKYFDEVTSLYLNRQIEKQKTMMNIIKLLRYGNKSEAKQLLKRYTKYTPVSGIKAKSSAYSPFRERQYHLQVNIDVKVTYTNNKNSKGEPIIYKETFTESKVITSSGLDKAKARYIKSINKLYNFEDSVKICKVINIDFISQLELSDEVISSRSIKFMRMKAMTTLNVDYDYIKENKSFLDVDNNMCVINNMVGFFKDEFKISEESFLKSCYEYYNNIDKVEYNKKSGLDFGIINNTDNNEDTWAPKDGISPACLHWYCEKKNISCYAYDVMNNCFLKNVSTNRNYKALCYFAINEHMYLVTDKALRETMIKRAVDTKITSAVNSALLEKEYESKNIFLELPIYENVDISDIIIYKEPSIFIYSELGKTNINDVLERVITTYNVIPNPKNIISFNHNLTKFNVTINNVVYYFCLDPSDLKEGCNYKVVKELCNKNEIEFKNQSFTSFIIELQQKFIDMKNKRVMFTHDERASIYKSYGGKCNYCSEKLKMNEFHIDHIRPLANGGTNHNDNLQVLCKACHEDKTQTEFENGTYNKLKDTQSSFNKRVTEIFNSPLSKSYAFIEAMKQQPKYNKVYSIDINKCRKNILYNGKYPYPVFSVMDDVIKYDGQNGAGIYYVESENYIPLRGNGWYYYPVIDYCLKNGIIEDSQIKYTVQASFNVEADYFNEFIDYCYNTLGEFSKVAINSMIGCFNLNVNKNIFTKTLGIVKGSYDAYLNLFSGFNKNKFIKQFDVDGISYYHMFEDVVKTNMETESPIYNQIVQTENILVHQLMKLVESKGGRVLDVNTDCVYCEFKNDLFPFSLIDGKNIDGFYYDDKTPMYKLEKTDSRLTIERLKHYKRTHTYCYKPNKWSNVNDVEDNNFKPLVDNIIESNKSYNILGAGGCGKSTLIKMVQKELTNMNKNFITLTPTNKAALIIPDAMTLHKFKNTMCKQSYLRDNNIDYIFVDEVSMMHEIFYKFLMLLKQLKPNLRFIISGDFEQLKPVNDRYKKQYKNSSALYELCDGQRLNLSTCRRADNELYNICNKVRNKEKINIKQFSNNYERLNLCYTNKKRIEINQHFMRRNIAKNKSKGLYLSKLNHNDNSQDVNLFVNTPIMAYKNCKKLDIVNNESFKITAINNDTIEFSNKRIQNLEIPIKDFQRFFYVAYAVTVHKSQGDTITKPYTIHEWTKFDRRLQYVALSRATTKNNINII